jgi:hypothetical protein
LSYLTNTRQDNQRQDCQHERGTHATGDNQPARKIPVIAFLHYGIICHHWLLSAGGQGQDASPRRWLFLFFHHHYRFW